MLRRWGGVAWTVLMLTVVVLAGVLGAWWAVTGDDTSSRLVGAASALFCLPGALVVVLRLRGGHGRPGPPSRVGAALHALVPGLAAISMAVSSAIFAALDSDPVGWLFAAIFGGAGVAIVVMVVHRYLERLRRPDLDPDLANPWLDESGVAAALVQDVADMGLGIDATALSALDRLEAAGLAAALPPGADPQATLATLLPDGRDLVPHPGAPGPGRALREVAGRWGMDPVLVVAWVDLARSTVQIRAYAFEGVVYLGVAGTAAAQALERAHLHRTVL